MSINTANAEYKVEIVNRQHEIEILQKDVDMLKDEISNRCKDHNKKLQSLRAELIRFTNIVGNVCHDEEVAFVDKTSSGGISDEFGSSSTRSNSVKKIPIPSGIGVGKSKSTEA